MHQASEEAGLGVKVHEPLPIARRCVRRRSADYGGEMKRRDFLQGAAVGAGILGTGVVPGRAEAASSKGDFYRVDAYCHFAPMEYIDLLEEMNAPIPPPNGQRAVIQGFRSMSDIDDRLRMMDDTGVDLSVFVPIPFIESAANVARDPVKALRAARFINDRMAEIVAGHPDRFKWVAQVPANLPADVPSNYDVMIGEFERAVGNGAVGACFVVAPTAKPPDHEDYVGNPATGKEGLFGKAESLNVPLWMHPNRTPINADYTADVPPVSRYNLALLLGWMLDTSVAMVRIAFSDVFSRHPNVKIICHHKGALVALFQSRVSYELYNQIGLDTGIPPSIPRPYLDLLRKFYVDTVFSGDSAFETEIVKIAYDFFGPGHMVFGTDASFGTNNGRDAVLDARHSVENLRVPRKQIENIFSDNILKIIPH
jgi:aminocarboxymuconate-semialdehyde decarboxylase